MTLPAICPEWCAADHGEQVHADDLEHFSQVRAIGRDVIVELRQGVCNKLCVWVIG